MTRTRNTVPRGALCAIAIVAIVATFSPGRTFAQTASKPKTVTTDSTRSARLATPPAHARGVERIRTLEAINIEGEIAVPQVLFITARDVRRYRDGLGKKFQLSAIEAGRAAVLPSRLRVADTQSQ